MQNNLKGHREGHECSTWDDETFQGHRIKTAGEGGFGASNSVMSRKEQIYLTIRT